MSDDTPLLALKTMSLRADDEAAPVQTDLPTFQTTSEVAVILRTSTKTILRWINNGALPAQRAGRHWLIKVEDINARLVRGMMRPQRRSGDDL